MTAARHSSRMQAALNGLRQILLQQQQQGQTQQGQQMQQQQEEEEEGQRVSWICRSPACFTTRVVAPVITAASWVSAAVINAGGLLQVDTLTAERYSPHQIVSGVERPDSSWCGEYH
jgi:hypothetical protein